MFNNSLYNDSLIGAGAGSRSWIYGAGSKVVEAVGTLGTGLTKYGRIAGAAVAVGSIKLTQYSKQRISDVAEAVGSVVGRVLVLSYFQKATQPAEAVGACRLARKVAVQLAAATEVSATLAPRVVHYSRMAPVTQIVGLNATNSGIDMYVGPTPDERITEVPGIVRVVFVTGPAGSAGV